MNVYTKDIVLPVWSDEYFVEVGVPPPWLLEGAWEAHDSCYEQVVEINAKVAKEEGETALHARWLNRIRLRFDDELEKHEWAQEAIRYYEELVAEWKGRQQIDPALDVPRMVHVDMGKE